MLWARQETVSGSDLHCWATTLWLWERGQRGQTEDGFKRNHPGDEAVWSGRKQGTEGRCPTLDGTWSVELGVGERGHQMGLWGFWGPYLKGWSCISRDGEAERRRCLGLGVEGVTGAGLYITNQRCRRCWAQWGAQVRNAKEYGFGENEEGQLQREEGHQKKVCLRTKPRKCFKQERAITRCDVTC